MLKGDLISRLCVQVGKTADRARIIDSAVSQEKHDLGNGHYVIGNALYDEKGNVKTIFPEDNRIVYEIKGE